jgi:hypothetical protein
MKAHPLCPFIGPALTLAAACADDRGDALGAPVFTMDAGALDQSPAPPDGRLPIRLPDAAPDLQEDVQPGTEGGNAGGDAGDWSAGPVPAPWQVRWIGDPPVFPAPVDAAGDGDPTPGSAAVGADTSAADASAPGEVTPGSPMWWAEALAAGSSFTLRAGGAGVDVSAASDHFLFVHQPVRGEATLQGRVRRIAGCASGRISFGVMVRAALTPGSAHAMAAVSGTPGAALQARRLDDYFASVLRIDNGVELPLWLRASRRGAQARVGYSADGVTWTESQVELPGLGEVAEFGLCASSHGGASICDGLFDQVTLQPGPTSVHGK